ncbi:MAG TPA: prepilin-type N-terminal cleavage/methylation domain-containing protein [Methylomirabilota bacterium]|nr:prepilin-type N-terminal cleavage/methylation domain-containing protein [Methylomirabilota bacterium]
MQAINTHRRQARAAGRGFTLLELVGVLAVVAILAAVLLPSVIRQMDQAAWTRETADLDTMAGALEQSILRSKRIPGYTGIPGVMAAELALPVNAITTNPRRHERAFLVDPNLRINDAVLPYTQTVSTAISAPESARLMIVSSLSQALPVASGILASNEFNDIWNTAENTKPATWTGWSGKGEDLRIKKINLEPMFHRIMLVNRDTNGAAHFAIDSTNTLSVPTGPVGVDAYYLGGSVLGLHDAGGSILTRYLIKRDNSFVFERGQWTGWIGPGDPYFDISDEFAKEAAAFLESTWNEDSKKGASQTGVLVGMYVFMFDYALWAEQCPNFSRHGLGGNISSVPEYAILDALGRNQAGGILYDASQNLLK